MFSSNNIFLDIIFSLSIAIKRPSSKATSFGAGPNTVGWSTLPISGTLCL